MSQNFSKSIVNQDDASTVSDKRWWVIFVFPAWIAVSFFAAQLFVEILVWFMVLIQIPLKSVNSTVLDTILTATVYIITIFLVVGLPYLVKKNSYYPSRNWDNKVSVMERYFNYTGGINHIFITFCGITIFLDQIVAGF